MSLVSRLRQTRGNSSCILTPFLSPVPTILLDVIGIAQKLSLDLVASNFHLHVNRMPGRGCFSQLVRPFVVYVTYMCLDPVHMSLNFTLFNQVLNLSNHPALRH